MISCPLSMKLQEPNAFLLYKTCVFELKPLFLQLLKNGDTVNLFFKNDFILNVCNKIN